MTMHLPWLLAASNTTTTVAQHSSSSGFTLNPIAKPIAAILAAIYSVVPNYGVAILVLSVLWMIIISPLTLKSTRSMLAMQKLQPQLKRLQEKYKDDKQAFATAQMDLFREHNVSPFGSCLPMLLPLPIFFALFRVIDGLSHTVNGHPEPRYLSPNTQMYKDIVASGGHLNAFGMNLAESALSAHHGFGSALPYFILLLIMGGTSYWQTAMMMSRNPASANNPQAKMMKFVPLVFVVFCIRFPAGVVLYYTMSNVCRIVQQDAMYRFDPKVKALVAQEVQEVESEIVEIESGERKPKPAPDASPPPNPNGRSRFARLLDSAMEQQKARQGDTQRGGSSKPSTSSKPPTRGASTSNGNAARPASGGTRANSGAAPRRQTPPGGHRTNRKKRRR